jgi:unsaturated chondroitin disaccharide hydrolase
MKSIIDEGIRNNNRYLSPPVLNKDYLEKSIKFIIGKIDNNLKYFIDKFPSSVSSNNIYSAIDNIEWTSSFWTGMLWLAYEFTGNKKYELTAKIQLESYKKRIDERICTDTHDLGFLYTLSCVASYRLTENKIAKETAIASANLLITRYFDKAGIIQAWGDLSDPVQRGRMIIDCCMNLPLLYWASEITGNKQYYNIAKSHVKQVAMYLIREDASCYHTYYMDVDTGLPKYGKTQQGYSDESSWARGQAWAIYGFILSYNYTKDNELLELAKKTANYFINRLPEDFVCYWDLIFTEGIEEKDSSAAAIACCGLLEIIKHLKSDDPYKKSYESISKLILKSLIDNYTTINCPESNGILLHSVYSKPENKGVDECSIWGDYFYFEALMRMYTDWKLFW